MKLPDSIRIGPYDFTVCDDEAELMKASRKEQEALDGYYSPSTARILINSSQPATIVRHNLCHEVVHGLVDITGYAKDWEDEAEELFTTRFANALLGALRDNPQMVKFLTAP